MKRFLSLIGCAVALAFSPLTLNADQPDDHTPVVEYFRTLHVADPSEPSLWCYAVSFATHGNGRWELVGCGVDNSRVVLRSGPIDMGNNGVHTFTVPGNPADQAGLYLCIHDAGDRVWIYTSAPW